MKLYQHGADPKKWNQQGNGGGNGNNGNSSHHNGGGNGNGKNGGHRKTSSNFATEAVPAKDSETTSTTTETNARPTTSVGKKGKERKKATALMGERLKKCCFCGTTSHPAFKCKKKKASKEMLQLAKKDGLCINCLRWGHFIKNCQKGPCGESGCQKKHHRCLHLESD